MRRRRTMTILATVLCLLLGACTPGDDDDGDGDDVGGPTESTEADGAPGDGDGDDEPGAPALFERVVDDAFLAAGVYTEPTTVLAPVGGHPWTMAGSAQEPRRLTTAATIWESPDARTWETVPLPPADPDALYEQVRGVAVHAGERWAIGDVGEVRSRPALWRTGDGGWTVVDAAGLTDQEATTDGIASDGTTLLAWGTRLEDGGPVLWTSSDGEAFRPVVGAPVGDEAAVVADVAAGGPGWVAVGRIREGATSAAVVWTSTDGSTWTETRLQGGSTAWAETVEVGPDGIVVGGSSNGSTPPSGSVAPAGGAPSNQPVVWRSVDGAVWSDSIPLSLHDDGRATVVDMPVVDLGTDGTTLVAVGGTGFRPHVWTSPDGSSWQLLANPLGTPGFQQGVEPTAIAVSGSTTLLASASPAAMVLDGESWTETGRTSGALTGTQEWPTATAGLRLADGTVVVVGTTYTPPAPNQAAEQISRVWHRDEAGWTARALPGRGGEATAVALGTDRILAVGHEDFTTARVSPGDDNPDGLVWESGDGVTWLPTAPGLDLPPGESPEGRAERLAGYYATDGVLGGEGTQNLLAVVALGGGYVVAGTTYSPPTGTDVDPFVVVSRDGVAATTEAVATPRPGGDGIYDLCTDGEVLVAAGGWTGPDRTGQANVWRRDPAGAWTAVEPGDATLARMFRACVHDGERFVAVGWSLDAEGHERVAVLTSADGLTWTAVAIDDDQLDTRGAAVAPLPGGGALVVGTDTVRADAVVWHLTADLELLRIDTGDDALTAGGSQEARDVVVLDDEVLVIGSDTGGAGIWRSTTLLDRLAG